MYPIRLDRAGEDTSAAIASFRATNEIVMKYSPAYASESKGSAGRLIQLLWTTARTLFFDSRLPFQLWREALAHSNWFRNLLPCSSIKYDVPYNLWYCRMASINPIHKFGQAGYEVEYRSSTAPNKTFRPRSLFGFFVGKSSSERLFLIYIPSKHDIYGAG